MSNVNSKDVSKKASNGIRYYSLNSIFTYFLQFLSTIVLSKILNAQDYGLFGTIRSWIASMAYFTDVGVSEGLIQQRDNFTQNQIKNYLAIRSLLSLLVCSVVSIVIFFFHHELGFTNNFYFPIFLITLFTFLDFYANLPKIYLSKNLEFSSLAKTEFLSNIFLYLIQIGLALLGFGVWALFLGLGAKFIVFIFLGFKNKIIVFPSFNKISEMRHLIRRGIYFQLTLIFIGLSSFLVPFLLNYQLPRDEVGIYFWISSLVTIPVGLILNFQSVLFPAFSKLQDQKDEFKNLINKSFQLYSIIILLIFFTGIIFSDFLIDFLFHVKWSRAKDIAEFLCFSTAFYCIRQIPQTIMTSLARAKDKFVSEMSYFITLIVPLIYFLQADLKLSLNEFTQFLIVANVFSTFISFCLIRDLLNQEVIVRYLILLLAFFMSMVIMNLFSDRWHQFNSLLTFMIGLFLAFPKFRKDLILIIHKLKNRT